MFDVVKALFPLIKLAKKLKEVKSRRDRRYSQRTEFPLIKLAKKLKGGIPRIRGVCVAQGFPLIKLAKKLKDDQSHGQGQILRGFH